MKRTLTLLLAAACLVGPGLGCRKPKTNEKTYSAPVLLATADRLMKEGKYDQARTSLHAIEENLPGSVEFPRAKIMLADSYFFQSSPSYPEAAVEYQSFLNYFPRSPQRDYALYHLALCHYSAIESAERDQAETRKAITAFQALLDEAPGSPYATEARSKLTQCWRRLAEHELQVGIFYVNTYWYYGAETRLKGALAAYPDYVDRERTYYYLGEAMRQRVLIPMETEQFLKGFLAKKGKEHFEDLTPAEKKEYVEAFKAFVDERIATFRSEAKDYYQKLVESYPKSEWAARAADRLIDMGTTGVKEHLDS
jgi:outer membrane protein assembly factor BamD